MTTGRRTRRAARIGPTRLVALLVPMLVVLAAACSGDPSPNGDGELTSAQAARIADVLFVNYDGEGATFQATTAGAGDTVVNMAGEIDWREHRGHATVNATGIEAGVAEVYWNEQVVLENRPELNQVLLAAGRAPTTYVARAPDPQNRDLDRLIAVVTSLASEQRDNAVLIAQTDGSRFVRNDTVRGVDVEVLQYGPTTVYWLDAASGELMRFEGDAADGGQPIVVDVLERGPQDVAGPVADDVVDVATILDFYPVSAAGP